MATIADIIQGAELPAQDYIVLGGEQSPGKAEVVGAGSPRGWDKREGYGFSGGFLVYKGDNLASFKVRISIWTPDQFAQWARFARLTLVKPPIGTKAKALEIQHPLLNLDPIKITSVVVEDVSQWDQDDDGLWTCEISFIQFRAPMPALGKPTAAIPDAKKVVKPAVDAAEEEIKRLGDRYDRLGG